jgi:hypothetical protein
MKRTMILFVLAFLIVTGWASFPQVVQAALEWRIIKDLDLTTSPLDVAPSADGQRVFVLTPGEVLVYSVQEGKVIDQIPVDKQFDRIASSPRADILTLTSSTEKALRMILLEAVYQIDTTGLPFKGAPDAPVTIAVFMDYQ